MKWTSRGNTEIILSGTQEEISVIIGLVGGNCDATTVNDEVVVYFVGTPPAPAFKYPESWFDRNLERIAWAFLWLALGALVGGLVKGHL